MNKFLSIVLVVLMAFQSMFQLTSIAYYEWNISEIEAMYCVNKDQPDLCCKGKCYISKKLDEQSHNEEGTVVSSIKIPDFEITYCVHLKNYFSTEIHNLFLNESKVSTGYVNVLDKPPLA